MCSQSFFARASLRSATGTSSVRNARFARASAALLLVWLAGPLGAQANVSGTVRDESSGHPLVNAEVRITALERSTRTDSVGHFLLTGLPAGQRVLSVRLIGYFPAAAVVQLIAGKTVGTDIALIRAPALLDTVAVVEGLAVVPDFEEHRRIGLGRFFTRADLAKLEQRRLGDVLATLQGLTVVRGVGNRAWIATSRGSRSMNVKCSEREGASPAEGSRQAARYDCACYAQVYLDDMPLYSGPGGIVPDINRFSPAEVEAIEYYAGPAQTPLKYSKLGSQCGVLVIHTRRTP